MNNLSNTPLLNHSIDLLLSSVSSQPSLIILKRYRRIAISVMSIVNSVDKC